MDSKNSRDSGNEEQREERSTRFDDLHGNGHGHHSQTRATYGWDLG